MMSASTSLVLVNPVTRYPQRKGGIVRRQATASTEFSAGLTTRSQNETIDAEFSDIFGEALKMPSGSDSPYQEVLTPQFLFKRRYIDYYA